VHDAQQVRERLGVLGPVEVGARHDGREPGRAGRARRVGGGQRRLQGRQHAFELRREGEQAGHPDRKQPVAVHQPLELPVTVVEPGDTGRSRDVAQP
jgi:hypothetical protein